MAVKSREQLAMEMDELRQRLSEAEQLIEAIKNGEVDAFAVKDGDQQQVYTLQSGDYAYRVLIEQFTDGAVNLTEQGLIVYSNNSFAKMAGSRYEKVIGTSIYDYIHPDSIHAFNAIFSESKIKPHKGEIDLLVNNKTIPVSVSLISLQPNVPSIAMIIADQTQVRTHERILEQKNSELLQRNAELASFTYIASHDLQEPLRKIRTFSDQILQQHSPGMPPDARNSFDKIVNAVQRMQNLITELLNFSQTNATEFHYEQSNLEEIVQEVCGDLSVYIEENAAVIKTNNLPVVRGIPLQLNQLFQNLISNSIKYRKADTSPLVDISAELVTASRADLKNEYKAGRYWKIVIKDNGIGFEQRFADRIFDVFHRLHNNQQYEGTGIGLAICKKIMQNHQGSIQATSEPGRGSTFSIFIPAEAEK